MQEYCRINAGLGSVLSFLGRSLVLLLLLKYFLCRLAAVLVVEGRHRLMNSLGGQDWVKQRTAGLTAGFEKYTHVLDVVGHAMRLYMPLAKVLVEWYSMGLATMQASGLALVKTQLEYWL